MLFVLIAAGIIAAGGALALLLGRKASGLAAWAALLAVAAGSAVGLQAAVAALAVDRPPAPWSHPWPTVPGAALAVQLDALSGVFLLPIFVVGPLIGLALAGWSKGDTRATGGLWAAFNALLAGMVLV